PSVRRAAPARAAMRLATLRIANRPGSPSRGARDAVTIWSLLSSLLLLACLYRPYHAARGTQEGAWEPVAAVDTEISDVSGRGVGDARDHCSITEGSKSTAAMERTHFEEELLYTLGFVDVDDQGHFWSETQVSYVVEDLTRRVEPDPGEVVADAPPSAGSLSARSSPAGSIFILYVPGWTHSGWACDAHVRNFRR